MKLNIRIQREEASTGDIKRGWANSTQAEDKDSGSNPGKEEMGGSRFRIQVVGNTKQICKCNVSNNSSENTSSTMIQGEKPSQFWHLNKRSFTSAGWEKERRESVAQSRSTMISLVTGAGVRTRLERSSFEHV